MLQQLFINRMEAAGLGAATAAGIAVVAGLILWLAGARFSRSLVTLTAVTIGALLGLRIPGWFNLPIGNWATAVGGSLVLGVSGYVMHRLWVGGALALLLAFWAAFAMLAAFPVTWPLPTPGISIYEYARITWAALPVEASRGGPFACGLAAAAGLALGCVRPRLAMYLLYSALGVSIAAVMGVITLQLARPQLLAALPEQRATRTLVLAGSILFGAIVQWRTSPDDADGDSSDEPKKQASSGAATAI